MHRLRITGLTAAAAAHILRNCNVSDSVAIAAIADELDGIDPAESIPSMYLIAARAAESCAEHDEPDRPTCCRPTVDREDRLALGWGRTRIQLQVDAFAPSPLYHPPLQPRFNLSIVADPDDLTPEQFAAHERITAARAAAEEMGRSHAYVRVLA